MLKEIKCNGCYGSNLSCVMCATGGPPWTLTLNEGGLSRRGGDGHRRYVDGSLASSSDVLLVV